MPIKKPVNQNVVKAGGKYEIPRNRRIVKRVRLKNAELTAQIDSNDTKEFPQLYWFRNGKYITPNQMSKYKFYDKKLGIYNKLSSKDWSKIAPENSHEYDGYVVPQTPYINKLERLAASVGGEAMATANKHSVPFHGEYITLKTKDKRGNPGKLNLTDVPLALLDSISVNAGRSNTNIWDDMALVGKESTFGEYSKALSRPIPEGLELNPQTFVNDDVYIQTKYHDYLNALHKKHNYNRWSVQQSANAERDAKYALENNGIQEKTKHYSNYLLADAFKRYATNPYKYNPGQKNYVPMLNDIKYELSGEKQLQDYWNMRGQYEYARGRREGISKPVFE